MRVTKLMNVNFEVNYPFKRMTFQTEQTRALKHVYVCNVEAIKHDKHSNTGASPVFLLLHWCVKLHTEREKGKILRANVMTQNELTFKH